jgi:hypothetical protein
MPPAVGEERVRVRVPETETTISGVRPREVHERFPVRRHLLDLCAVVDERNARDLDRQPEQRTSGREDFVISS